jgi:hypothetical protein
MADWENPPSISPSLLKRLWVHGFVAGLAVVLVIFLGWYFLFKGEPVPVSPEGEVKNAAPQAPSAPVQEPGTEASRGEAPPPEALLRHQLEDTLSQVREADLKKNLAQFLDNYVLSDSQREKKRRETARIWETYDYLDMRFQIGEIKALGPERVFARVIWEIKTRHRRTRKVQEVTRTYDVWFAKDSGKWRIQTLGKAG